MPRFSPLVTTLENTGTKQLLHWRAMFRVQFAYHWSQTDSPGQCCDQRPDLHKSEPREATALWLLQARNISLWHLADLQAAAHELPTLKQLGTEFSIASLSPAVDSVCVWVCVCVLLPLLKENENENLQRVIWMECLVQSNAFQGDVVSDVLHSFPIYKSKVKKQG